MPDSNQMFGKSSGDTPDFLRIARNTKSSAELNSIKIREFLLTRD